MNLGIAGSEAWARKTLFDSHHEDQGDFQGLQDSEYDFISNHEIVRSYKIADAWLSFEARQLISEPKGMESYLRIRLHIPASLSICIVVARALRVIETKLTRLGVPLIDQNGQRPLLRSPSW